MPTMLVLAEKSKHRLTHCPHRGWWKAPVPSNGREDRHPRTKGERQTPHIWIDYNFPTKRFSPSPLTLFTVLDGESAALETLGVQDKGLAEYPVTAVCQAISRWGRKSTVLSWDQEPAIIALAKEIKKSRAKEAIKQRGPRRDSQSKGPMEAACVSQQSSTLE